jgi:hypothetical protein
MLTIPVFDKTNWALSNGNCHFGFKALIIDGIELTGTSIRIPYHYEVDQFMQHMAGPQEFRAEWEHDKTEFLNDDKFRMFAFHLIYLAFAAPANFARRMEINLDSSWEHLFSEDTEYMDVLAKMEAFFYHNMAIERDNMRYALGHNSKGYAQPIQSIMGGLGFLIGNFHEEVDLDYVHPGAYEAIDKGTGDYASFKWSEHLIDESSKVIVNMSYGKESLMTFYALRETAKLPAANIPLSIFGHIGYTFQETYKDEAKKSPYNEHALQYIMTNMLKVIAPICDVRYGGPINMLTTVYETLNELAYFGEGVTHQMNGDEYDRHLPLMMRFSDKAKTERKVYSYDYEQSPDFCRRLNEVQVELGGIIRGSLMFGITGYQGQMMLDRVYHPGAMQKSCHTVHLHKGFNCGKCQKCTRVGVVKQIMASLHTVNYKPTYEQLLDLYRWTEEEFFISYMPIKDAFLHRQYAAMRRLIEEHLKPADIIFEPGSPPKMTLAMACEIIGETAYSDERPALFAPHLQKEFERALALEASATPFRADWLLEPGYAEAQKKANELEIISVPTSQGASTMMAGLVREHLKASEGASADRDDVPPAPIP